MAKLNMNRIAELWPSLNKEARQSLTEIAEGIAATPERIVLSKDERAALERSREDFKNGEVLSQDEYRREMVAFMGTLPYKA